MWEHVPGCFFDNLDEYKNRHWHCPLCGANKIV
jgi:rubredoxin